jgi:hypothetical protein
MVVVPAVEELAEAVVELAEAVVEEPAVAEPPSTSAMTRA